MKSYEDSPLFDIAITCWFALQALIWVAFRSYQSVNVDGRPDPKTSRLVHQLGCACIKAVSIFSNWALGLVRLDHLCN
jgi:hypothetical protein